VISYSGQWIGTYKGTNSGTFVVEIDEVFGRYEGTAVAWDNSVSGYGSVVKIQAPINSSGIHLKNLDVLIVFQNGNTVPMTVIDDLRVKSGVLFPTKVDVEIAFKQNAMEASWVSSIGTAGAGNAIAQRTQAQQVSVLKPKVFRNWGSFKAAVNKFEPKRFIYRGQESNRWRLRSSYHRTGRASLDRYTQVDVQELQKTFSSLSSHHFDLENPVHYAAFLNLAQHHGYPTPLLDWSWSPYIAAYFAFRKSPERSNTKRRTRVFKFDAANWNNLPRATKIAPVPPTVTILDALAFGNPRAIPQQSISTFSNVDDIESHIQKVEEIKGHQYLEAFDLPLSERANVMRELDLMGINAGSLFPGFDGACEALRERNFSII
jgi:hypothetical protein